jgi:Thioredoxin
MEHRLLLSVIFLLLGRLVTSYVKEAADGSVCFNNCNGHGDCIDYSCHCWLGYHGDDCGSSFVEEGQRVVPILSAGHFNLTRKNFTTAVVKSKMMLVGFSAYSCHRCIAVESEYEKIALEMTKLGLTFARADADQLKSIALEHDASELPALVLFQKVRQRRHITLLLSYTI